MAMTAVPVPVKNDKNKAEQGKGILEHAGDGVGNGALEGADIICDRDIQYPVGCW